MFTRLFEEIAYSRRSHSDDHLDASAALMEKKGTPASPATAGGEQGLSGTWRAYQQYPFGRSAAEPGVLLRIFEEIDDLDELIFGLSQCPRRR